MNHDLNGQHNQYFQSVIRKMPSSTPAIRLVVMFHGEFVYEARAGDADLTAIGRRMAGH